LDANLRPQTYDDVYRKHENAKDQSRIILSKAGEQEHPTVIFLCFIDLGMWFSYQPEVGVHCNLRPTIQKPQSNH